MATAKVNLLSIFAAFLLLCAVGGTNQAFGELTLPDLYAKAMSHAERIKIAEEQVKISQAGRDKAQSALLPRLSGGGAVTRFSQDKRTAAGVLIQPESAGNWNLRLEQSLSLGGREFTSLNLSEENIARSKEDLRAMREEYLLMVSQSYFEVLRAQKSLEIAGTNLERLKKHRGAAEKRLRLGEITKTGLLRVDGELSGAQSDFIRATNALEMSRQYLIRLVGVNADFKLKEPPSAGEGLPALETIRERALSERAELRSVDRQKRIAQDQIKLAKSLSWPNVNLSVGYAGADQYPVSVTLNRESIFGSVGISIPIFDGGLRKAEVTEAQLKQQQIDFAAKDLQKAILVEVEGVYLEIVTHRGMLKYHQDQLAFARDNHHAVTRQFEFGLASALDVIDANAVLVASERKLAETHYNYQYAQLKLKRVMGESLYN